MNLILLLKAEFCCVCLLLMEIVCMKFHKKKVKMKNA